MTKRWMWARRLLMAVLLGAALYLVPANLFLNTPLASWAINRRPSVQVTWTSAWTVWPGWVHARGLEVRGHQRSVRWWVKAERASGYFDLPGLFERRIELRDLRGAGVRSSVVREPRQPDDLRRRRPRRPGRPPGRKGWTTRLPDVTLATVREIRYGDFLLTGTGEARGGFSVQVGGDFQLLPTTLRMTGARLDKGPEASRQTLVRDAVLQTEVRIEPYAIRLHPGMEGWDFLSGRLEARGSVPDPPLLDSLGNAAGGAASLAVDVRAERGRFVPGSRVAVEPRPGREQAPLRVTGSVASGPGGPVLLLTLQAAGLALGQTADRPPFIQADVLDLAATSSEVRLRHLFTTARQINRSRTMSSPLMGTARARGVRLDLRGSRLASRIDLDRLEGKVDLAALLERRLLLTDLRSEGGAIRLDLAAPSGTAVSAAPPWAVHLDGARLAGLRGIGFEPFFLQGDTALEMSLSLEPGGPLQVDTVALAIRDASLVTAGATVAQRVGIQARGRLDPMVLGELSGIQALRFVSGSVDLSGRIASFGFLETYFAGTPWLNLSGSGDLRLGLRVERGHLGSGTTIAIPNARLEARFLDSLATGTAAVNGSVEAGREGPDGRLQVRFDRFGLQSLRLRGRPTYIRGRGLRLDVTSQSSVDLTAPAGDIRATIDLPSGEVPDLRVFNPYLPPDAGIAVLGGRGRVKLHWDLDGATKAGRGRAELFSEAARLRFQGLELGGGFALRMPMTTRDLESRRFELNGTELSMARIAYRNTADGNGEGTDWWARLELPQASVTWEEPLRLRGSGTIAMKNADPLLLLFAPRRQFLRWFQGALGVENVVAKGSFRLEGDALEIPSLDATGGSLELSTRMLFSKSRRVGDMLIQYGRLVTGIELRNGQRTFKLRKPREWYESGKGFR